MAPSSSVADSPISHLRVEEYSYRVPTPPRIVVPPPSINSAIAPQFGLTPPQNHPGLDGISYENMKTCSLLEWTYERRRHAQAVLPFLYLGPLSAAKDRTFLTNEGITMMLGIRQKHGFGNRIMNAALGIADELGIQNSTVDLVSDRELVGAFSSIGRTINNHLVRISQLHRKGQPGVPAMGKVLIFCESGNERSAAVVAAYLMETHPDVDYIRAMQVCQSQRFCVNFDDGMKRLLQSFWDILQARRDVAHHLPAPTPIRAGKRALSRDEDSDEDYGNEDMDMGAEDDAERFERRAFAPFVDLGQ